MRVSRRCQESLDGTTEWIATARGAVDVADLAAFAGDAEILVVSTTPGDPLALVGAGADLWRKLVAEGPVRDLDLGEPERVIVREMQMAGLASEHPYDDHRVACIPRPWLSSAVHELVYALVASVARDAGIDAVFIKGPVLHAQGLREREHSGDVDVWVDPAKCDELIDRLTSWGWKRVPFDFHKNMYHSVTMEGSPWGCEVDIHYRFPGMAVSPEEAFARLRAGAQPTRFAGVEARVPALTAHAVVFALHTIRPKPGRTVPDGAQAAAVNALRRADQQVVAESSAFGASAALRTVLSISFPDVAASMSATAPPADWCRRFSRTSAEYHLKLLQSLPWRERPEALRRILWPSARKARASLATDGANARSDADAHVKRLRKGLRQVLDVRKP